MYRSATPVLLLGLVVAIAMFPALGNAVPQSLLLVWLVIQVGLAVYRVRLVGGIKQSIEDSNTFSLSSHRSFIISTFITGCVWGSLVLFMNGEQPLLYHVIVFSVLFTMTVGALPLYSSQPAVQLAFSLPILLPLAAWCFTQQAPFYLWAGALVLAYLAMQLFFLSMNWRLVMRSAVQLANKERQLGEIKHENVDLQRRVRKNRHSAQELKRDRQLFVDGPVVMYRCSADHGWPIERISGNIKQFGYDSELLELRRTDFTSLIHPEDLAYVTSEEYPSDNEQVKGVRMEYRLRRQDGTFCWVYDYTMPVFADTGELTHLDGYLLDIDRLYEANEALLEEKERAQVTLESIGDAVITTNIHGRIDFMNSVAEQLTGWTFSLARYSKLAEVFRIRQEQGTAWVDDPVQSFLDSPDLSEGRQKEAELFSRQGFRSLITYNVAPIRSHQDKVMGYVLVFLDVTDKVDMQRELEFQARHDVLTGLLNRREFEKRLSSLVGSAKVDNSEHVLLYIDLDQFKLVNDTCGHGAGDELLIQLTHNLQKYLKPDDTFARLGGDEFGILLENCSLDKGQEIAQIIRAAVKQYQFSWEGRIYEVGASIGLVAIDKCSQSNAQIMAAADVACYSAKENGRNRVRVYQGGDKDLLRREVEMDWATRIAQSMEDGNLVLYFQEIVPVKQHRVGASDSRHIEILLRIRDQDGKHVEPETFLSSAERYNLMPDLDRWVVRHSFEWFNQCGFSDELQMSINLSGLTLSDNEFAHTVKRLLREYNVPPASVCFEVTETAAIASLAAAADFIEELKSVGCRFSLDDFGSGLSSFAYLKALPVDYLKIDGNFVRNILKDSVDRAMVGAINDIGHTLNLKTVAEYVNDVDILPQLEKLGVDYAQGYAIARPRKLKELRAPERSGVASVYTQTHSLH